VSELNDGVFMSVVSFGLALRNADRATAGPTRKAAQDRGLRAACIRAVHRCGELAGGL
jgi:hypothetical protein